MPTVEVNPHNRAFGVEIEFGLDVYADYDDPTSEYNQFLRHFGFSDEDYGNDEGWEWGEDGTLFEFRSPILQGKTGFTTLRRMMDKIRSYGGYVTGEDGLHIHHNAPEFVNSHERTLKLLRSWKNNMAVIYEMVAPRRHNSWACPEWDDDKINYLASGRVPSFGGDRPDLNVFALDSHGTIEVRLHEGTLDPDAAIAWIQFGQLFIQEVVDDTADLVSHRSDVELMSRLKLPPEAMAAIAAKKARGFLDAA